MQVEAMIWSDIGPREYAAALQISPHSLRNCRDRLMDGDVEIDWRAHLHPTARPGVGTSASQTASRSALTAVPDAPEWLSRRYFSDTDKRAIVAETEAPGVSVSAVARRHGIVTGLLFRWRVQFGVAQKKRAKLAPVTMPVSAPETRLLSNLVQPGNLSRRASFHFWERMHYRPSSNRRFHPLS
jgi:transposase-like protein